MGEDGRDSHQVRELQQPDPLGSVCQNLHAHLFYLQPLSSLLVGGDGRHSSTLWRSARPHGECGGNRYLAPSTCREISHPGNPMTTATDGFGATSDAVDESCCGADTDREALRGAPSVQGQCARQAVRGCCTCDDA